MRLFLLCISLLSLVSARAQHHHFLYIQGDLQQPFYVKMGSNVLGSSADGFLIIPRLKDSAYEMVIGFPAKKFPEYRFLFSGFRKDRGMALKNFGEKGWGLFDYQTTEIVMGEKIPEKEEPKAVIPAPLTNDAFTVVLASVIDDPGLLATPLVQVSAREAAPTLQPVVRKETVSEPSSQAKPVATETAKSTVPQATQKAITPDTSGRGVSEPAMSKVTNAPPKEASPTASAAKPSPQKEILVPAAAPTVVVNDVLKPSAVQRLNEKARAEGLEITYIDLPGTGLGDTVQVLIPYSPAAPVAGLPAVKDTTLLKPVLETQAGKAPVKEERVVLDSPSADLPAVTEKPTGPANRSNCLRMASEKDLAAVRKKMVGIKDEDEMVLAALKDFKQRCYTTEQVKTISYIFTREEGKYKLIDAAYPYVFDPSNYGQLETLLKDKYFIYRFKALVNR